MNMVDGKLKGRRAEILDRAWCGEFMVGVIESFVPVCTLRPCARAGHDTGKQGPEIHSDLPSYHWLVNAASKFPTVTSVLNSSRIGWQPAAPKVEEPSSP